MIFHGWEAFFIKENHYKTSILDHTLGYALDRGLEHALEHLKNRLFL